MAKKATSNSFLKQQDINIQYAINDAELKEKIENHIIDDNNRYIEISNNFVNSFRLHYITVILLAAILVQSPGMITAAEATVKFVFSVI